MGYFIIGLFGIILEAPIVAIIIAIVVYAVLVDDL